MRIGKITHSGIFIPEPLPEVDKETLRVLSDFYERHTFRTMGISAENFSTAYTMGGQALTREKLDEALVMIANKPKPATFIVNIDDLLQISRDLRKTGIKIKRGRTLDNKPAGFFWVFADGALLGTLYVDVFRYVPRGKIYQNNIGHHGI